MVHSKPLLPDEIYENVIDLCRGNLTDWAYVFAESYETLLACCLTCRTWLPRARLNLYAIVRLTHREQVASFLASLVSTPFLGEHVKALRVGKTDRSAERFVAFASTELVQRLPCVRALRIEEDAAWGTYPPIYPLLVARYNNITELRAEGHFRNMAEILRLVWKLRSLECVYLNPAFEENKPLSDTELRRLSTNAGARNRALQSVELERNVGWAVNFPPRHVFGDNVVELTVHWADSFLARQFVGLPDHVSCLPRLRRLILVVAPVDYTSAAGDDGQGFSQWIASVIPCARGHTALRSIVLRFWRQQGDWFSRPISRYVFLQWLVTQTFGSAAANLEDRHDLVFELPLGSPDVDGMAETTLWWEEQLQSRLPELHARLVVTLHALTGALSPRTSKVWIPMRQDGPAQLLKAGSDWSYASDVDSIHDYQDGSSPRDSERSELDQFDLAADSPMYDSDTLTGITPLLG